MKELLDKITSYNLFNYLLPGVLFSVLAAKFTPYGFLQPDIVVGAFIYYFVGLVISRVGSLILEPLLKGLKFVTYASYSDFVAVSKHDPKLEVLSESNNSYRTLCATFLLLGVLKLFEVVANWFPPIVPWSPWILVVALFVLFMYAYKKQSSYITSRIDAGKHEHR